jgi:hypothetical protein
MPEKPNDEEPTTKLTMPLSAIAALSIVIEFENGERWQIRTGEIENRNAESGE